MIGICLCLRWSAIADAHTIYFVLKLKMYVNFFAKHDPHRPSVTTTDLFYPLCLSLIRRSPRSFPTSSTKPRPSTHLHTTLVPVVSPTNLAHPPIHVPHPPILIRIFHAHAQSPILTVLLPPSRSHPPPHTQPRFNTTFDHQPSAHTHP